MKVLTNEHIDIALWEEFVAGNPHATPFQTWEFYRLLNHAEPSSGQAVCVAGEDRILALAVIQIQKERGIKGFFSRRGVIFGGPLLDPSFPEAMALLLEGMHGLLRHRVIYLETRNQSDFSSYRNVFEGKGWVYHEHLNCVLGIESREQVLSGMSESRRRQIRMSLDNGATWEECGSLDDLKELYSLLSELYTKEVRLPLPPLEFFTAIYKLRFGKIFIVRHNGRIIGGSFCPVLEKRAVYTFYYYGLKDFHKKIFPTHLALMAAIEYALQNRIGKVDFMGAGKPGKDYGVRDYKLKFGCELQEQGRFIRIESPLLYRIGETGLKITRRLGL
ncbi:MAG: lipid II:glycine glycyltransferase FemX [Bacteroidales bacterium]